LNAGSVSATFFSEYGLHQKGRPCTGNSARKFPVAQLFVRSNRHRPLESHPSIEINRIIIDSIAAKSIVIVNAAIKFEIMNVLHCQPQINESTHTELLDLPNGVKLASAMNA